jgi:peptidoglycan/xylan/chitin deacetylase (PgdA/CDA1 family)
MDLGQRTQAAYDLLPEERSRPTRPTWRHRLATGLLGLLSLLLVAGAVSGVWYQRWWTSEMGFRAATAQAPVSTVQQARWTEAADAARMAGAGVGAAPVVLSYHDIDDDRSASKYVVSARTFARQMEMLDRAGYHTLSQDQLVGYLRGSYVPAPRSAVITFDDGTRGLYTHADKVLERHGFQGVSFLISGVVGTKAPYYLTWAQVDWMQESGRWSFGGHTHDTHAQQTDTSGRTVHSALTSPIRTPSGELETFAQFTARIERDQRLAFGDFAEHGLPRPSLFAWPFSEVQPEGPNTRHANAVHKLLNEQYAATLVNSASPLPADRGRSTQLPVQRLEVMDTTTADELFTQMAQMQALPLTTARPAASDTWMQPWSSRPVPMTGTDGLRPAGPPAGSVPVDWRPQQTSTWTGYRVSATLTGLGEGRVGLRARVGSHDQVTVSATRDSVRVERIDRLTVDPEPRGRDHDVTTGKTLRVSIEVRPDVTVVTFGGHRKVLEVVPGNDATGGHGLYFFAEEGAPAWPQVRDLQVTSLP